MLAHLVVMTLAVAVPSPASGVETTSDVQVRVDSEHREVVVTVGPIHIPEATPYSHHPSEKYLRFEWPVRGWVRGYRLDLLDSAGRSLPRETLHHAGVANLDRRQLPYPLAERLLAVGRETQPVMLPASIGVPLAPGQQLLLYYALANASSSPIEGAELRLFLTWTPDSANPPRDVFPLFLDANPKAAGADTRAFDVPPGVSIMSAEFTLPVGGWLRALGGHLHDYAVEMRLEDVRTGKILARLKTKRHKDGRLISVSSTRFVFKRRGLHLAANHQYRVIALYDNPTSATIPEGAMAFMAGPFIPDDVGRWPPIDATDPVFQEDLAGLLGEGVHHEHEHEVQRTRE